MATDVIATGASLRGFQPSPQGSLGSHTWARPTPVRRDLPARSPLEEAMRSTLGAPAWDEPFVVVSHLNDAPWVRQQTIILFDTDVKVIHDVPEAVRVVDRLCTDTGLGRDDILKAADIKRRTFYMWQSKDEKSRQRVSSLGRLWELSSAVDDLQEIIDRPLPQWLGADRERIRLLCRGRFDTLLDLAVRTPAKRTMGTANGYAVGSDLHLVSPVRSSEPVVALDDEG
jgi:hypothetical protein